jgi:putative nucleotidyltransferase with HDIG domain
MQLIDLKQIPEGQRQILRSVMILLASWDRNLFTHGERVARELLGLAPGEQAEEWYWAGLLHDIGKITIAPTILQKRSSLTRREKRTMQQHSVRGAAILKQIGAPLVVVQGAKYHHERWDGTGYPYDMGQQQIPRVARVLAVADVYTALTSNRPYRRALAASQAREEIERNAGTQFDPEIVVRFFEKRKEER